MTNLLFATFSAFPVGIFIGWHFTFLWFSKMPVAHIIRRLPHQDWRNSEGLIVLVFSALILVQGGCHRAVIGH